jgi:hypothetical protein
LEEEILKKTVKREAIQRYEMTIRELISNIADKSQIDY